MDSKKLNTLKRRHVALRNGADIARRALVSLAKSLGRKPSPRGKEPTYVSEFFALRPLSIPSHRIIKEYTAKSILDQLEEDIFQWEEDLKKESQTKK
jgi:hypothetical protein